MIKLYCYKLLIRLELVVDQQSALTSVEHSYINERLKTNTVQC